MNIFDFAELTSSNNFKFFDLMVCHHTVYLPFGAPPLKNSISSFYSLESISSATIHIIYYSYFKTIHARTLDPENVHYVLMIPKSKRI